MDWNKFLQEAVAAQNIDLVRQALAEGANPNDSGLNETGNNWATPLYHAASRGDIDIALALLKGGALVMSDRDEDTLTLHTAVEDGNLPMVELLLKFDADKALDRFDYIDRTPLMIAVEREHTAIARRLLEAGADVNAHNAPRIGDTALHKAAATGTLEMVKLLLNAGADPLVEGWMRLTPLDTARERKRGDGPRIYALLVQAAKRF